MQLCVWALWRGIKHGWSPARGAGALEGALPRGCLGHKGTPVCLGSPAKVFKMERLLQNKSDQPGQQGVDPALPFKWREILTGAFNTERAGDRQCF